MSILRDYAWEAMYSPDDGNLLSVFYIPALSCAVRYDRTTGFFKPDALAKAAVGVEELVRNNGHMRLIVGCTLDEEEVDAIQRGESLRDTVEASLQRTPFQADSAEVRDALELLAWMVAKGYLDVRLAVPCDPATGKPCAGMAIFHEKAGILEDKTGERLVFTGSLNESASGWMRNWESFHVFCSWKPDVTHLNAVEENFQRLWADRKPTARVMELGQALREKLLHFLPKDDALPRRLPATPQQGQPMPSEPPAPEPPVSEPPNVPMPDDVYRATWEFIHEAPTKPGGGDYVGEATAAVTPWPHQVRAFDRMYHHWPPRLLIADEVGLGKTIEAGLVIRQAWLSGRAKRICIMAPKAVLRQWQLELREKFNLNVPIYESGQLCWYPSPALEGMDKRDVADSDWHKEPLILVSSQLMRRTDRARQLLEDAEPWDLLVLDEAHHARRKAAKDIQADSPNRLLRLMRGLKEKTRGLILLTATPMQVHPVEVWDLLNLLGMPPSWDVASFLKFFELSVHPSPTESDMAWMARLFREMEEHYQPMSVEEAARRDPHRSTFRAKKILKALHSQANTPLKMLSLEERRYALLLMKSYSPTRMLISRHTRELLRRYHQQGKLTTTIAERQVEDYLVTLSEAERALYEEVEDYISSTYNKAAKEERTAIGFVMTIYRRRLASSFDALEQTLQNRLNALNHSKLPLLTDEDLPDDDLQEESPDMDEAGELEKQALRLEEADSIRALLQAKKALPRTDTKAQSLLELIARLREEGYRQVIVFTQYTDTLDSLRKTLGRAQGLSSVLCFSGRGGEQWSNDAWESISREKTKELFREGKAEILLCTDAAAEGLNLQTCGALINYDMPWNPMKVEQRIGRIDRLGQQFPRIKIINLMYADTVETDVYVALRERIGLFSTFVGKLQPILSRLPRAFSELALQSRAERLAGSGRALANNLTGELEQRQQETGFDLDEISPDDLEMPQRPAPSYDLAYLHGVLTNPALLPPGCEAKELAGGKDYAYLTPGRKAAIRVTTDATYFEQHPESVELWSPGSPVFPDHI